MKLLRRAGKVLEKDTRRNMPVKSPISKKSSEPAILKSVTVLIGEISKKLPSRASEKTVQKIFQEARKSSEKLRQKAPPQIQSALPSGASFFSDD